MRRRLIAALLATAALAAACTSTPSPAPSSPAPATGSTTSGPPASPTRPNVVFVLTDDLAWNLVRYMPHVQAMMRAGMTFDNYTVTDSLCCPSRASIFTGNFPHDTHVVTNDLPDGGADKFRLTHDDHSTFATSMGSVGYRTAFFGKYLNAYQPEPEKNIVSQLRGTYVPPGWTTWGAVGGGGYVGFDYSIANNTTYDRYGSKPDDFVNTVLQHRAVDVVRDSTKAHAPFMLEVATFSPHKPYAVAPHDVGTFPQVRAPRTPAFGRLPSPTPRWLVGHLPLNPDADREIDKAFRMRVEAVQSVDRMIGTLQQAVRAAGQAGNTVFVFSSDNGYHMGEYMLREGKQTAFDTDVRVPLVVTGPGIRPGTHDEHMVQNIDLRPTFDELAGVATSPTVDGHSIVPLLHGERVPWRSLALIEHVNPPRDGHDPDVQTGLQGNPPSYQAIRSTEYTYVRYVTGDREYYNLRTDPYELRNLGPSLSSAQRDRLDSLLNTLVACHGSTECWTAGRPTS